MIDLQYNHYCPLLEEICEYVRNPVFDKFCLKIKEKYGVAERIEFSKCSMAAGWNIKFKKSGKTLCIIYPHEMYFTVLVVVGKKRKRCSRNIIIGLF